MSDDEEWTMSDNEDEDDDDEDEFQATRVTQVPSRAAAAFRRSRQEEARIVGVRTNRPRAAAVASADNEGDLQVARANQPRQATAAAAASAALTARATSIGQQADVQVAGANQARQATAAAAAASALASSVGQSIGAMMGSLFAGASRQAAAVQNRHATGVVRPAATSNKKKRKRAPSPPPLLPMEKGKALHTLQGFDAIDLYYPHVKAHERTQLLHWLLQQQQQERGVYTKKWTHDWRVAYEKQHPQPTLWALAEALSKDITTEDGNKKLAAKSTKRAKLNNGAAPKEEEEEDSKPRALPTGVGNLQESVITTLDEYFCAHVGRQAFQDGLDAMQPVGDDHCGAISCMVCADDFDLSDTVPCLGKRIHFFCKPCFHGYVTVTRESGPIQCIPCPVPDCEALFATADARANLSTWDVLRIAHREQLRNQRVALAAKAVLHCECGAVGIVREEDMGDGRVSCPGCPKSYCAKCGNDDHGTEPCGPPKETLQWLDKHTKECPNCKQPLEKNGGCDHMTCRASSGGCGYNFWWSCGCPYQKHKPGCQRIGEQRPFHG